MVGFQLILTLMLMGGAIAYFGNRIGRIIGRRRYSFMGMRPKHSSFLMTIVSGVFIAAFTLAVLSIVSSDVRTALFEMKQIQQALAAADEEAQRMIRSRDEALAEKNRLQQEAEAAVAALEEVQAELEERKRQVATLKELAFTLESNVQKIQEAEAKLKEDVARLTQQYMATENVLRSGSFVYLKDEIVAAGVMRGDRDGSVNEQHLMALLEQADAAAFHRGVRVEGKERAIELGSEQHFFQAVDLLNHDGGRWVVRVVAAQNTVVGEPLLVYLHLFPERLIYEEGHIIGTRRLHNRSTDLEAEILNLLEEVNQDALLKGMMTTEDGRVGQLAGDKFVDALLALRRVNGPARLDAVVVRDTWNTEGPLEIDLVVTRG